MTKTKKKTQITAYVTQELGEWVRNYAHENYPKSQGQIVREALEEYRKKHTLTPFTDIKKKVQGK